VTTLQGADNIVFGIIDAAWKATGAATAAVPMHYANTKGDKPLTPLGDAAVMASDSAPYARTLINWTAASQITQGRRRYETTGTVSVQIYAQRGDGGVQSNSFLSVALAAMREHVGTSSGIWFFNVQPVRIGIVGSHFQANANAQFRFQEVIT